MYCALPAPEPVPPICDDALNDMRSPIKLIVPAVPPALPESRSEVEFNVNVPVPALMVIFPVPVLTLVALACVTPTPVKETG